MGRIHLFELEDQDWFPRPLRDAGTDFVRFMAETGNLYAPIVSQLKRALIETGSEDVLDLCSGGGGPVPSLQKRLAADGCEVRFTLTDKFPNRPAFEHALRHSRGAVDFSDEAVDATAVPPYLSGFRTLFASFHHFRPATARRILQDAVDQRRPIAVFEITVRNVFVALGSLFLAFLVLLATPFIRPFRWSRLFWTYVVPIMPFFVAWDGSVSCLRTYSIQELQALVDGLGPNDYVWQIGRERGVLSSGVNYLIGYPDS